MLSFTTKGLPQSGEIFGIFSTAAARSSALPLGTRWMKTGFEALASIRRYTSSIASVTCPMAELYRGMDRAALDAAYNNGAAVRNSAQIVTDWQARSDRLRARHAATMDLRYGPAERNRIDLFPAGPAAAPLLVFIHGGYWQMRAKEVFSFVATGPLAPG